MLWLKLKAGALQLTLFIAVVIALLLMAFILLVQTHKRFKIQKNFIVETTKNADRGINYVLQTHIPLRDTVAINLYDEDYKTLTTYRDFWGVFEKVTSVSKIKNNNIVKTALVGGFADNENRVALYLQDNNKPLVLVGNTKIDGLTYLPKQGAKSGTIAGHSYYGSQLIYGTTRVANRLPKLLQEIESQIKFVDTEISKILPEHFLNIEQGKVYENSFFRPTQYVFSNSAIRLVNTTLIGNIVVQSKSKIIVESSSILKDVLLIAPEIEIKNSVIGNFQTFASKKLLVGERVQLNYPSALVLNEKIVHNEIGNGQMNEKNTIKIGSNSMVKGLVLFLGQPKLNNYDVQLELKENSTVVGEVYCNQNMELKGTVYGSVYVDNFIARQFGSVYQNHIYNGTILEKQLHQEYVGISFNNSKKGLVKWLY